MKSKIERIKEVRELTGVGLNQIMRGMKDFPTDDPLLAALYIEAQGLAVYIKRNRSEWERDWAVHRRKDFDI